MAKTPTDERLQEALSEASGIAYDGCHKIYVLLDAEQYGEQANLGYGDGTGRSQLIPIGDGRLTPSAALEVVKDWYAQSCWLRFISTVATNHTDPDAGFSDVIAQGKRWRH